MTEVRTDSWAEKARGRKSGRERCRAKERNVLRRVRKGESECVGRRIEREGKREIRISRLEPVPISSKVAAITTARRRRNNLTNRFRLRSRNKVSYATFPQHTVSSRAKLLNSLFNSSHIAYDEIFIEHSLNNTWSEYWNIRGEKVNRS